MLILPQTPTTTKMLLNLIPFGKQNITKKGFQLPDWKRYQTQRFSGGLADYQNVLCVTGKIPDQDKSLVVIDFDGEQSKEDIEWIGRVLRQHKLFFSKVVRTGNGGTHFYIMTEYHSPIFNIHSRKLKVDWFPRCVTHVDIRGEGGIVFYPPTKFIDSPFQYQEIWSISKNGYWFTIPTNDIHIFINDIYLPPETTINRDLTHCAPNNTTSGSSDSRISYFRKPIRDLLSPGAHNIGRLAAETGKRELLYWKAIWLEAKIYHISVDVIFALLEQYQPTFDKVETLRQLPHLGIRPFSNEKLSELFPDYVIPIRHNLSEEITL